MDGRWANIIEHKHISWQMKQTLEIDEESTIYNDTLDMANWHYVAVDKYNHAHRTCVHINTDECVMCNVCI